MTQPILIHNVQLVTLPDPGPGWILCEDGEIAAVGAGAPPPADNTQIIDGGGLSLLPGFIDIHVHGAAGYDTMDANPDGLRAMAQFYAQHGVTTFLATTWTDSRLRIRAALDAVAQTVGRIPNGATLLGAHMEGPYLNPEKCGAQSTTHIRRASEDEANEFLQSGVIRLVALAPEYQENQTLIKTCAARGVPVSAAHTGATYDEIKQAIPLGLTQTTHTFNAMTGLHHREPGVVGAALTLSQLCCELIADNVHVHPAVMRLLHLCKGAHGIILISDAIRSAGLPDGDYPVDERTIYVREGIARLADGTLAGSTVTMNRALHNFMQATDQPLRSIWQTSSLNAARALGIDARKGSISPGKDADLTLVNDAVEVFLTIAEGEIVYRHPALGEQQT